MRDDQPDVPVPGDLIWIRRRQWRVRSAHAGTGLTRVVVDGRIDGRAAPESRSFLLPCDRWSPNVHRSRFVSSHRALAWLAACAARVHPAFTPGSIVRSKTSILAYQLEPALAILAGKRRVLIADDVGLGKTVQAALIIAETSGRSADARVLVVAPASLLTQWADELRDRFNVVAHTADADSFTRLRSERPYLNNPWKSPGVWLASPDYLKQPHVIDGMPRLPFDLLVIDEAHTMAGNSQRHSAIDSLARSARQVVLLTATPHDGDGTRFLRLMSLGSSGCATGGDTVPEADALTIFRRTRTGPVRHLRTLDFNPGAGLSRVLAAIDSFERARSFGLPNDGLLLLCAVFRKRALSSLAALAASLTRRLAIVNGATASNEDGWMQPGLSFHENGAPAPEDEDEWPVMRAVTGLPRARERAWLERLLSLTARVSANEATSDPKLTRLTILLRRSREPVVVFTEYRDSLLAIAGVLAGTRRIAVLHGGLSGSDQRRALEGFLDGRADALLATDVASQGLNLQHRARWVVHFDLPWTPMRLEQRVGRVDRIGQTRPVHVTAIGVRHPAQMAVRQRVATRQEASDNARLRSCTRWTRAAEGLARLFARQRALAARWRGPDPSALPRARVTASTLRSLGLDLRPFDALRVVPSPVEGRQVQVTPSMSRGETQAELRLASRTKLGSVTIIELPLITETGEVIERWFGWAAVPPEARADPPAALVRRARALSAAAQRRLARLHAAQVTAGKRTPIQPGLFDARDLTGSPAVTGETVESNEESPGVTVRIGEPRPLVIL